MLPGRILVLCLSGLGDAARYLPALALLRRQFPKSHITVVTMFRSAFELLEGNPDLDDLRCIDFFNFTFRERLAAALRLRSERFDLSVLSFPANRLGYNIAQRVVGSRWRAAHRYLHQSLQNLWFLNNIVVGEDPQRHNQEENLRLVRAIARHFGLGPEDPPLPAGAIDAGYPANCDDRLTPADVIAGFDPGAINIAIHPYSSSFKNMRQKCWPAAKFAELINMLAARHPTVRFLLISGPEDRETSRAILAQAHYPVLFVEESLRRVVTLLKGCDLFIGNDAGVTHVAAAAGVPVIAIFGPTDWRRLRPWCERYAVVKRDLPCMPCFYYSSRPLHCGAGIDYACVRELSVAEVAGVAAGMLERLAPRFR